MRTMIVSRFATTTISLAALTPAAASAATHAAGSSDAAMVASWIIGLLTMVLVAASTANARAIPAGIVVGCLVNVLIS